MSRGTEHLYEFGPFVLDPGQHLLSKNGRPVPLTPKTYDMLVVLVENRGRMLTKAELMKALWPDSFVEESNLTQQISMVRRALGETAGEDRYIVTIPSRGYRFAAPVKGLPEQRAATDPGLPAAPEYPPAAPDSPAIEEALLPAGVSTPVDAAPAPVEKQRPWALVWALPLVAVAIVVAAYWGLAKWRAPSQNAGPRSLAILPFQSLKRDSANDFLGVSLADAVITKLGYIRSVTVRPSSAIQKYRDQVIDIPKVAAELHVDTLLTGNFLRDGQDLRITSQLVDVRSQSILWRGSFDFKYERLLAVQDTVARQIIKGLELSLSSSELARLKPDKPVNPLAYEYYLRGVDLYSRNDYRLAIKMLQQSVENDPNYALTWAHLGRAHTANASFELGGRKEYNEAQAAYEKALSLQPSLIEAQIYMANLLTDTGRVEQAVPLLRKALETNPNHAEAHWELGYAYRFAGMLSESVAECERARQLDPGVKVTSSAMNGYLYLGQYDKFLQSLDNDESSALMLFYRGFGEYYKGNRDMARQHFDAAYALHPTMLQAAIGKALSEAMAKRNAQGLEVVRKTESRVADRGVGDPEAIYKLAQAFAVLGDQESALRVLKRSIENGFFSFPYFEADPLLDSIRRTNEFSQLMSIARARHTAFKLKFF